MVGIDRNRLGGGEEKGGRGSNGFGVGFEFGRIVVKWRKWVEWSGVEWSVRVNAPRTTTGCN